MPHLSAPSTIGAAQAHIGDPVTYRVERNEQERERNLQSRYQVCQQFYKILIYDYNDIVSIVIDLMISCLDVA